MRNLRAHFLVTVFAASFLAPPALANADGDALISAVQDGLAPQVTALLARHADVNATDATGASALSWAVMRNNADMTARLLKAHADANRADANGVTPLMLAIDNNAPDIAGLLLAAGADVGISRGFGETPLMSAVRVGSPQIVQMLLARKAVVNMQESQFGQTPLMWAAGQPAITRLLLDAGADTKPVTRIWQTASTNYTPSVTTLGVTGIPWNNAGDYTGKAGGLNALMFAVQKGDLESVRMLLDKGMDVNFAAADGTTPLLAALYRWDKTAVFQPGAVRQATQGEAGGVRFSPDLKVANLLLDRGANPNASDRAGYSPLHGAVLGMIDAGARGQFQIGFNPSRNSKIAPMPKAPVNEAEILPVVRRLLEAGANPNKQTIANTPGPLGAIKVNPSPPGSTPYHIAAATHSRALAELLAAHGADANLRRKDGHTPFSVAVMMNDLAEVTVMTEHGADLQMILNPDDKLPDATQSKAEARKSQTILHIAAGSNANYVVEYLAAKGAPLKLKNDHDEMPIDLADKQELFRYNHDLEGVAAARPGAIKTVIERDNSTTDAFKRAMGIKIKVASN